MSPLRKLRKKRKLTLVQLARLADVDASCLSRLERGILHPRKLAQKLVAYFGVAVIDLDAILGYERTAGK